MQEYENVYTKLFAVRQVADGCSVEQKCGKHEIGTAVGRIHYFPEQCASKLNILFLKTFPSIQSAQFETAICVINMNVW